MIPPGGAADPGHAAGSGRSAGASALMAAGERPPSVAVSDGESGWTLSLSRPTVASRVPMRVGAMLLAGGAIASGIAAVPRVGDIALWGAMCMLPLLVVGLVLVEAAAFVLVRDTAVRLEIGAHHLRWTFATGREERWNVHDLAGLGVVSGMFGRVLAVRTRGRVVRAVRMARSDEAVWLGHLLTSWIRAHHTAPDPEQLARMAALKGGAAGRSADPALQ